MPWRIKRPRFKSQYRVEVRSPDLVLLFSESGCRSLTGRLHPLLAPLIDGKRTAAGIARRLDGRATELDVDFGLSLLADEGYLEESDPEPPWLAFYSESLGLDQPARARLDATAVAVLAFAEFPIAPFVSALEGLGLRVSEDGEHNVVLVDDYLRSELDQISRRSVEQSRPWMIVKPAGAVHWIGPVFDPSRGACWGCLAARLREIRRAETYVPGRLARDDLRPPAPDPPSAFPATLHLAAIEVLKWILRGAGEQDMLTIDYRNAKMERHPLVRQQRCPHCQRPAESRQRPPELQSRRKVFQSDGGHRTNSPEHVFLRFQHHISPFTGVISRIEPYGPVQPPISAAYIADHLFAPEAATSSAALRRKSAGKGMTAMQARTSALCEALERYSGVFRGDEPRRRASYEDLGELAIHPSACLHFSRKQYASREQWNRLGKGECRVPAPFDERRPIEWCPVWSLSEGRFKYLPLAYCYYGCPPEAGYEFCRSDSNGCAAGACLEEAIVQGFLELVERDAIALWWYNRIPRPMVEPDGFRTPFFRQFRDHYGGLGREVRLYDVTSDFRIPAFAAVSWPRSRQRELILGFGAHFDPELAAARALTEANQFLEYALAGKPRCLLGDDLSQAAFLFSAPAGPVPSSLASSDDLLEDVKTAVDLARRHGLEVLALDQTRSDVGLPVVRVVIPGLRHFWPRFGPGRLYQTPVEMGWLKQPQAEEDLNPALFFT
ncbi:MAG: TOMM precursor leader peptide-binding protein [Acidobacteria bacterium]|nr:TOMM precursor leader peptide-binding protein [Acidobacteriota bacterium]